MVARHTSIPAPASPSSTRSNHPKSHCPGRGSTVAQEQIPAVTIVTPASRISARSCAHTSSGHCSGL